MLFDQINLLINFKKNNDLVNFDIITALIFYNQLCFRSNLKNKTKVGAKKKSWRKALEKNEKPKRYLSNIEKDQEEIMSNAHNIVLDNLNSKTIYGYEDQKTLLFGK